MIDTIHIFKSDVTDRDKFESAVGLHECIIASEDDLYFTIEGSPENIESFRSYCIASFHYERMKLDE